MSSRQRPADDAVATDEVCAIIEGIDQIASKWRLLVIYDLQAGEDPAAEKRFNELKRSTGASSRTLSRVLDDLEGAGLVERRVEDRPIATYYRLSEKGRALCPVFESLDRWSEEWVDTDR